MFDLAWPLVLLALPLPWLVRRWLPPAPDASGPALRLPFEAPTGAHHPGATHATPHHYLAWLVWLALVLAAARPQWLGEPVELPLAGRDLMLAVDISESMGQQDFQLHGTRATRLAVVRETARQFIQRREGDRIGLILFGARAYLLTPLTFDRDTVQHMLQQAEIGLAGRATAIGDAIGLAVKRLQQVPEQNRVLILLTDGANTAGEIDPERAAKLAAQVGLRIYTVGLGADSMQVPSLFGSRIVNPSADLDEGLLKRIADTTGGIYFRARDSQALERFYAKLDHLEPRRSDAETFRPVGELYPWPLGLALGLVVSAALGRLWQRRRTRLTPAPNEAP